MTTALLYSGGMDSACAWWALGKPRCLYVGGAFGPARWANMGEMAAINKQRAMWPEFAGAIIQKPLDFRPFMRAGEYMFARLEIMALAAWAEGFDGIMAAYTSEDMSSERAAGVIAKLRDCVPFEFTVEFPLVQKSRVELLQAALDAGAPPEFILASHSCVRQSQGHCGNCENCSQRAAALRACNLAAVNHNGLREQVI